MNWQLISFLAIAPFCCPAQRRCFIVLMLRKTSRLLAWQWSLLFGITGAIVCASKTGLYGLGLGIRELDYYRLQRPLSAFRGLLAYLPLLLSARFSAGLQKHRRHWLYSGRCGGLFTVGHPCAYPSPEVIAGLLFRSTLLAAALCSCCCKTNF